MVKSVSSQAGLKVAQKPIPVANTSTTSSQIASTGQEDTFQSRPANDTDESGPVRVNLSAWDVDLKRLNPQACLAKRYSEMNLEQGHTLMHIDDKHPLYTEKWPSGTSEYVVKFQSREVVGDVGDYYGSLNRWNPLTKRLDRLPHPCYTRNGLGE